MRRGFFASVSAFCTAAGLSALAVSCSPQPAAPGAGSAAKGLAAAAAAGVYSEFRLINESASAAEKKVPMDGKIYRSGQNVRMEFNDAERGPVVIITTEKETILIATEDGKQTAIKVPFQGLGQMIGVEMPDFSKGEWLATADSKKSTQIGPCSAAGEAGTLYRVAEDGRNSEACVSQDGVLLESKENGTVVWQTTKVVRGPQPAEMFTVPAGMEVIDMEAMMKGFGADIEKMMKEAPAPK
jgi:hypothetical protein